MPPSFLPLIITVHLMLWDGPHLPGLGPVACLTGRVLAAVTPWRSGRCRRTVRRDRHNTALAERQSSSIRTSPGRSPGLPADTGVARSTAESVRRSRSARIERGRAAGFDGPRHPGYRKPPLTLTS